MIDRPAKDETGPTQLARFAANRTAHRLGNRSDNRQPQTTAAGSAVAAGVEAHKRLENLLTLGWLNAGTIVFHMQNRLAPL